MKILRMRYKLQDQKGFALIMALFLVIVISTVAVGSFATLGRQQRTVQRGVEGIRLQWAAEGIIDRGMKLFGEYTRADGFPGQSSAPDYDVYDSRPGGGNAFFAATLTQWFTTLKGNHSELNHVVVSSLTVKVDPTTANQPHDRLYDIKVTLRSDTGTALNRTYWQQIRVKTGNIFDYSVFYNKDLEITAGPNWELQGPIFSNGDVYLMNNKGSTLTLSTPGDVNSGEYYALKSAGNIYFYFKTTLAPNYLLENSYYREAVQENIYRTDLQTHPLYSSEYSNGVPFKGVEVYPSPYWLATLQFTSAPPLLYTFSNGLEYGTHTIKVKQVTRTGTVYYDLLSPSKPSTPMVFSKVALNGAPYLGYAQPYTPDKKVSVSTAFEPVDPNNIRKLHKEWSPSNPVSDSPFVNPYWTGFPGGSAGLLISDRKQGVERRALPVGDSQLGPHVLIEPLDGTESSLVIKYKFETYANIRFTCSANSAGSCNDGSYQLMIKNPADETWITKAFSSSGGLPTGNIDGWSSSGLQFRTFYDYRLGASVRILDIDIQTFLNTISTQEGVIFSGNFRPVIYVRTESPGIWTPQKWAPVAVRIRNGAKLPADGLSIATNGRLWVLGDYNVTDPGTDRVCSVAEIKDPDYQNKACKTPSADLYSDSFGMLSNTWNLSNESTGRSLMNSAGLIADRTRVVTRDAILNAAVVTGFLPSQLVKAISKPGTGWCGSTDPATIDLCATNSAAVGAAQQPIDIARCAPDPQGIPCLYGGPTICYGRDGFFYADIERDVKGIWLLKPTGNYYLGLKAKNDSMVNSPQFTTLLAINHPASQTVITSNVAVTKRMGQTTYVETSRTPIASGLLDVSVHLMPHEYFEPVNPQPLPITETRGTDTLNAGNNVYDERLYWDESPDRPFSGVNYPGVYARKLWKSEMTDLPVHYTCIKNSEVTDYYDEYEECLITPGGEVIPGTCTIKTRWTGRTDRNSKCKCDDTTHVYTNPQSTLSNSHVTSVPGGVPQDFSGHPTSWTNPDGFIGSGICPSVGDNYFSTYPKLYYAWRGYAPLWQTRYSGGLENVVNLQEAWYDDKGTKIVTDDQTFTHHFSGTLVTPWDSKQLVKTDGTPAFYGTTYYIAPIRDYDFNEGLRYNPPPLPEASGMQLFSVKRKKFQERDGND